MLPSLRGGSATLRFDLVGVPPFSFAYTDGTVVSSVIGAAFSPYFVSVSPLTTTSYLLVGIRDSRCVGTYAGSALVNITTINSDFIHLPFNNNFLDISGGAKHASPAGTYSFVGDQSGNPSSAVSFNGSSNAYATLPSGVYHGGAFAATFKFKLNAFGGFARFFDFGWSWYDFPEIQNNVMLSLDGSGQGLNFHIYQNGTLQLGTTTTFTGGLQTNTWYKVSFSVGSQKVKLCMNGQTLYENNAANVTFSGVTTATNYLAKSNRLIADPLNNVLLDEFKF